MKQEEFDRLMEECINNEQLDKALDLYLENENLNPLLLEKFIVKIKSSYYACELISIKANNIDIDNFIDMIINTNDKTFIGEIALNNLIVNDISEKNILKLKNACKEDK